MKTIAVDFDGTIVEHAYPAIGRPIPFAIDTLKKIAAEGNRLILWTVRSGKELDEAVEYCASKGLEFYAVNKQYPEEDELSTNRKIVADIYIDDRNLGGLPDWGQIYALLNGEAEVEYNLSNKKNKKQSFIDRLKNAL